MELNRDSVFLFVLLLCSKSWIIEFWSKGFWDLLIFCQLGGGFSFFLVNYLVYRA